jgi:hypothetical protein
MRQLLSQEFDDTPVAEYKVDPKDFDGVARYMGKKIYGSNRRLNRVKKSTFYQFFVFVIFGLLFSLLYSYFQNTRIFAERDSFVFFGGVAAGLVIVSLAYRVLSSWIIPHRASQRLKPLLLNERNLIWRGRDGLVVEATSTTVFFDYKGINEISAFAQGMIISSGLIGFYIPNSGFMSEVHRQEFLTFLKSKLQVKALSVSTIFNQIEA